jgi:hypothetical protein
LGPAGFVGFYRVGMAAAIFGGALVLPMGLLGAFGAAFWADFPTALRLVMAVTGTAAIGASAWLPCRMLVRALGWRGRIRVTSSGVLVETGLSSPRHTVWLSPRTEVVVARPNADELGRGGVVVSAGDARVLVGVGYAPTEIPALLRAITAAVAAGAQAPPSAERPQARRLGPTWREALRALARDLSRPLRHPTPYFVVDVAAIVLTPFVSGWLTDGLGFPNAYPLAFALFCAGLFARRYDGSYIEGLRHYAAEVDTWSMRYLGAAVAIGLFATIGMAGRLGIGPAFGVAMLAAVGLHVLALRRARADAPPRWSPALDLTLAATLVPLSLLHEAAMFEFIGDSARGLGPLALAMVPVTALFAYLPVRLHAFVDDPGDRANVGWFWITVGWLALQPLLALGPEIARQL